MFDRFLHTSLTGTIVLDNVTGMPFPIETGKLTKFSIYHCKLPFMKINFCQESVLPVPDVRM